VNPSTAVAVTLVDELVRCGVREVVLAPGSRSAPLALALHAADAAGRVRLHVRVDERSAGFLAVGLARTSGSPVPVLTTSGTAVANLHPAVLEASHAGLPLLVLSADRPARLRGTGANQTTDQVGLFGGAVRLFADVPVPPSASPEVPDVRGVRPLVARCVVAATGARTADPGPVQLNLQLDDPLLPQTPDGPPEELPAALAGRPDGAPWTTVSPTAPVRTRGSPGEDAYPLDAEAPTVVVAGDDAGPPARVLAEAAGWPLLAEPTSGARTGSNALRCYRLLLDGALAGRVRRVVVFGHPTLSRPVMRLLSHPGIEVVVVSAVGATWTDPGHAVARVVPAVRADGSAEPAWLESWLRADKAVSAAVDAVVDAPSGEGGGPGPYQVARAVSAALPPEGLLVVGSSNPVRDLDLMTSAYPVGERRKVIGNRGLAGIDGTVSTAVGAALARRSSRALAYVGDLTFVHDANGLVLGPDEPRPDLTIVVANDDGGSIFAGLEQGAQEYAGAFERVFGTPHGTDLASLCAASGTAYRRCGSVDALSAALAESPHGIEVIEVPVDRADRRALGRRLQAAADAALAREAR